jgi:multidrug efflux pump subunit AcrB
LSGDQGYDEAPWLCGREGSDDNDAARRQAVQFVLLTVPFKREDADGDQHFGVVDTTSAPPLVMAAAIVALGFISFNKLPVTRMPNVDVPVVSVTVTQFGAAPAELESRVTKAVEDAVSGVAGAHHINSTITDGISNTTITFRLETDTDRALNDVKDAVTSIRANLPRGIDEPMIQRVDIAGLPILTYAAIAPGKTPEQLSWFVDDVVIRALQGVRGVARVDRIGTSSAKSGSGSTQYGFNRSA